MKLSGLTNGLLGGSLLSGNSPGSQQLRDAEGAAKSMDPGMASLQLHQLIEKVQTGDYCQTCKHGLQVMKKLAMHAPEQVTPVLADVCLKSILGGSSSCHNFGKYYENTAADHHSFARDLINVLTLMDPDSLDGDYFCHFILEGLCPLPPTPDVDISDWWTEKPDGLSVPQSSGETFKVLHLSDIHLSLDYTPGSEANCIGMMCCVPDVVHNPAGPHIPAPKWGYYTCDCPHILMDNSLESIPLVMGQKPACNSKAPTSNFAAVSSGLEKLGRQLIDMRINKRNYEEDEEGSEDEEICQTTDRFNFDFLNYLSSPSKHRGSSSPDGRLFEFALFTGDMIDHNPLGISKSQSIMEEKEVMMALRRHLGDTPVYAVLGNHDSYPFSQVAQQSSGFAEQFSFNADLMADLWADYGWIDEQSAQTARLHYGAYSTKSLPGLRVISLNSNFWYRWNLYNYWETETPDQSGSLRFLVDELLECEKSGERAWVIAHVPPGGIPDDVLPLPSKALTQIFERFSPETIAGIFFGHTHMDEYTVLYKNGDKSEESAVNVAWIAPSVTPLLRFNPSWRYYEVDSKTFEIMDSVTYFTHLNDTFEADSTPEWHRTYSAREYIPTWPETEPLNAKFWHQVSEQIRSNAQFAQVFSDNKFRFSPYSPDCTNSQCMYENYCYTTSMSMDQAIQCRVEHGVRMKKMASSGPAYPMPKPAREYQN